MRIFRKNVFSFCYSMATSWSHKFDVSNSVDVNDDDEYRYTPLIMRLCLGMSGVRKRAQKIVFLVAQMGYISPIGLKKPEIDFPLT